MYRVETGGCLVIVELGTNAGFQIISEVRDFLLQVSSAGLTYLIYSIVRQMRFKAGLDLVTGGHVADPHLFDLAFYVYMDPDLIFSLMRIRLPELMQFYPDLYLHTD
jgi:hypothetical protein